MIFLHIPPDPRFIQYTGRTQVRDGRLFKEATYERKTPGAGWVNETAFVCPNTQKVFDQQPPRAEPQPPDRAAVTAAEILGKD
jgi:hypothetical protein